MTKKTPNKDIVKDEQHLRAIIRDELSGTLHDVLNDPDFGKTVKPEFLEKLKEAENCDPDDYLTHEEVKEKYPGE